MDNPPRTVERLQWSSAEIRSDHEPGPLTLGITPQADWQLCNQLQPFVFLALSSDTDESE
jgi:hypothetical protein